MVKSILKKIKRYKKTIKGGMYLLIGTSILNVLNYLFHLYAGRTLGPADYGVFFSFLSMLYVVGVPSQTIQMSLTNFIVQFQTAKSPGKIKFLILTSFKKLFWYGILGAVIFLLFKNMIARFLNIEETSLFFIFALLIIANFLLPIGRAGLQGLQKFKGLGFNYGIEGVIKIGSAVLLIALGWKVAGALWALILATFFPIIFAYPSLKKILRTKSEKIETKQIYQYSLPVFLVILGTNLMYNIDVLMVKHFFPPLEAGQYAALSLLGKIIFFGCSAIGLMMFPKVSELYLKKKSYKEPLAISMKIVAAFGIVLTLLYFLFPQQIITLLFGKQYLAIANVLGLFGVFMTLFSLAYLLFLYYLSIKELWFIPLIYGATILEIALISLFHQSIIQIVLSLIIVTFILLVLLIIRKEKEHENIIFNPHV